jgi:hypothetical protein
MLKIVNRFAARKGISLLCLLGLLFSFPGFVISEGTLSVQTVQPEVKKENQWEDKFHQQVQGWIKQISARESSFKTWETAKWESYPFGPGSKQWIVLILDKGEEIGYLIIGEEENGELLLIEYGKNEDAILSRVSEREDLAGNGFIYSGLLWAKNEKNVIVDLITNEAYEHVPIESLTPYWLGEKVEKLQLNQKVAIDVEKEPILFYSQLTTTKDKETTLFDASQSYFFQTELLPQVTALYNVLGIHYWDWNPATKEHTGLFVGLSDEGVRFLSLQYLNHIGHFSEVP